MTDHQPRGRAHEPMTGTGAVTTVAARRRRWVVPTGVAVAGALVLALAGCQSADAVQDVAGPEPSASTVSPTPTPTPSALATAEDLNDPTSEACGLARGVTVPKLEELWQPVADATVTYPDTVIEQAAVVRFNLDFVILRTLPAISATWPCLGPAGYQLDAANVDLQDDYDRGYELEHSIAAVQSAVDALPAGSAETTTAAPSPSSQPDGLRETFDAMLAAIAPNGEPGLVPFLANPSDGDLWGISNWAWTNPQCQDDAVPAEGAEGSCSATFTKDGAPLENIFTFTMIDGAWRLADSWVWDENEY